MDFNQLILNQLEEENAPNSVINEELVKDSVQPEAATELEDPREQQLLSFTATQMDQVHQTKEMLNSVLDRISAIKHRYDWV